MLKNEYLDAKIGVDTEENEPYKSLIIWLKNQSKVRYRTFQLSLRRPQRRRCLVLFHHDNTDGIID